MWELWGDDAMTCPRRWQSPNGDWHRCGKDVVEGSKDGPHPGVEHVCDDVTCGETLDE